jgi:broad specificity phosphatase PhoE
VPTALIVSHSGVIRTLRHTFGVHNPKLHNLGGCWFFVHRNNRITVGEIVSVIEDITGDSAPTDSL